MEHIAAQHDAPATTPAVTVPALRAPAGERLASRDPASILRLQQTAGNAAVGRVLARHPAGKVLKFAITWMSKRTFKQVSKHIAKHGRNIAGKALHSVFKRPNDINWLIKRTLAEAEGVAERQAKHAAGEVLEEGGIRIERQ